MQSEVKEEVKQNNLKKSSTVEPSKTYTEDF